MAALNRLVVASIALVCVSCTSQTQTLSIDSAAPADQVSFDGLYPVVGAVMDHVWARPDMDLTGYRKILIQNAGIQYRPVKERMGRFTSGAGPFPITDKNKARLAQSLTVAIQTEFADSNHFEVVTTPGPDVAILRGGLFDVVSFVPPDRMNRYDVYLERLGEATLVLEFIDSESGAVLIRAADRRNAGYRGGLQESNSVTNWSEVNRLTKRWARQLRDKLDLLASNLDIGSQP